MYKAMLGMTGAHFQNKSFVYKLVVLIAVNCDMIQQKT